MYPDLNWQPDSNRLFDKGGSILVKRRFEGEESFGHLKVFATGSWFDNFCENDLRFLRPIFGKTFSLPWSMLRGGEYLFSAPYCTCFYGFFSRSYIGVLITKL